MSTPQVTPASELREKIEARRYSYFTLPILDVTVKYRKPDLLKLALNKQLPSLMAGLVIDAYKGAMEGVDQAAYKEKLEKTKFTIDNDFLKSVRDHGYSTLTDLTVSHKIMNVQESDLDNNLISWNDIPESDAIAFVMHLINDTTVTSLEGGGEATAESLTDFPDGKPVPKRNTTRKSR